MIIRVLPRGFFEKIMGSFRERELLESCKIISIESSSGSDTEPPFSPHLRAHRHLLCLVFDDVCNEPLPEDHDPCVLFTRSQAEQIMRFVDDGKLPLLIHCTAGISRSGAIGEVLDWYFNCHVARHPNDHQDFMQNNRHILPNDLVRRVFLRFLRKV